MITLALNVTAKEFADLTKARALLDRASSGDVSDAQFEQYRKIVDRVQSGVLLAAMVAADTYNIRNPSVFAEVANG